MKSNILREKIARACHPSKQEPESNFKTEAVDVTLTSLNRGPLRHDGEEVWYTEACEGLE